jgi:cytochrome c5
VYSRWLMSCMLGLATLPALAIDADEQVLEQRIQSPGANRSMPSGSDASTSATSVTLSSSQDAPKSKFSGEAIYQQHCSVCHAAGVAGAPKFRDIQDWAPRLKQKKLEQLIQSVTQGYNAMPPKGTCQECEHDDFKNSIEYMLPPQP